MRDYQRMATCRSPDDVVEMYDDGTGTLGKLRYHEADVAEPE